MQHIAHSPARLHPSPVKPGCDGFTPPAALCGPVQGLGTSLRDETPGQAGGAVTRAERRCGASGAATPALSPRVSPPEESSPNPPPSRPLVPAGKGETAPVVAIDGLHFAGVVPWYPSRWNGPAWDAIAEAKATARNCHGGKMWADLGEVSALVRSGAKGNGKDYMPYVLELLGGSVVVFLSPRMPDRESFRPVPNVRVEIHGRACLLYGAREAYELVRKLIEHLGGELDPVACWGTRVDVCADLPGVDLQPIAQAVAAGKVTSKAVADLVVHGPRGAVRQIACGKSNRLRFSAYDKAKQVRDMKATGSEGQAYAAAMVSKRWGGVEPEHAVRAEWQAGREWLREQEFRTLADLLGDLPRLLAVATRDRHPFFKLTARPVDRENRNQGRAGTARVWSRICAVFRSWAGWTDQPAPPPRAEVAAAVDPKRDISALISYGGKALTATGNRPAGLLDLASAIVDLFDSPQRHKWEAKLGAACDRTALRLGTATARARPAPA